MMMSESIIESGETVKSLVKYNLKEISVSQNILYYVKKLSQQLEKKALENKTTVFITIDNSCL